MKKLCFFVVVLCCVSQQAVAAASVLITAFDPFAGRSSNHSQAVAAAAKAVLDSSTALEKIDVKICVIPTVYDEGAEAAEACYSKMSPKPSIVLSLGEADCNIRLETAAHNRDSSKTADNKGQIRAGTSIIRGGVQDIGFNLPVQEMFCSATPETRKALSVSNTPGGFVCNNTAYSLANFFLGKPVQYGFVHVPKGSCGSSSTADVGKTIANMLTQVVRYNQIPLDPSNPLPHRLNDYRLPTAVDEIVKVKDRLSQLPNSGCDQEFLDRLKKQFSL